MVKCIEEYVQVDDFKMYSKVFQGKKLQPVSANLMGEDYNLENGLHCKCKPFLYIRRFPS